VRHKTDMQSAWSQSTRVGGVVDSRDTTLMTAVEGKGF